MTVRRDPTWPELLLPFAAVAVLYTGSLVLAAAGTDAGVVSAYQVLVPTAWLALALMLRRRREVPVLARDLNPAAARHATPALVQTEPRSAQAPGYVT